MVSLIAKDIILRNCDLTVDELDYSIQTLIELFFEFRSSFNIVKKNKK